MTWKGRVVYDRPKNKFTGRDLTRIFFAQRFEKTPEEFGSFALEVLEDLMRKMEYRRLEEAGFWSPFIDKLIAVGVYNPEGMIRDVIVNLFPGLPGGLTGAAEVEVNGDTYIIEKRRRQSGGL